MVLPFAKEIVNIFFSEIRLIDNWKVINSDLFTKRTFYAKLISIYAINEGFQLKDKVIKKSSEIRINFDLFREDKRFY